MRASTLLIVGSLGANVGLAVYLYAVGGVREPSHGMPSTGRAAQVVQNTSEEPALAAQEVASFFSGDINAVLDRMKKAGFSPGVIRAIGENIVREQFRPRFEAIAKDHPFWESAITENSLRTNQEYFALDIEMRRAIRDLVGPPVIELSPEQVQLYFGGLSPEKVAQIMAINGEFIDRRADVRGSVANVRERSAAYAQLDQEQSAQIEALLTPAELDEYNLRASASAQRLRNRLAAFEPTADEFATILKLQKAYDDTYGRPGDVSGRAAGQLNLESEIEASLTAERAAEYRVFANRDYPGTAYMITKLGLPSSTTEQVLGLQREYQQRMSETAVSRAELPAPGVQTPEQVAASLQRAKERYEFFDSIDTRLNALIGPRGVEIYRGSPIGGWYANMKQLQRPLRVEGPTKK